MRNRLQIDCESVWGTGPTLAQPATATVRFFGDPNKERRVDHRLKGAKGHQKEVRLGQIPISPH